MDGDSLGSRSGVGEIAPSNSAASSGDAAFPALQLFEPETQALGVEVGVGPAASSSHTAPDPHAERSRHMADMILSSQELVTEPGTPVHVLAPANDAFSDSECEIVGAMLDQDCRAGSYEVE